MADEARCVMLAPYWSRSRRAPTSIHEVRPRTKEPRVALGSLARSRLLLRLRHRCVGLVTCLSLAPSSFWGSLLHCVSSFSSSSDSRRTRRHLQISLAAIGSQEPLAAAEPTHAILGPAPRKGMDPLRSNAGLPGCGAEVGQHLARSRPTLEPDLDQTRPPVPANIGPESPSTGRNSIRLTRTCPRLRLAELALRHRLHIGPNSVEPELIFADSGTISAEICPTQVAFD